MKKVDVYRCLDCYRLTIVEKGNYHPWCSCGYDQFDWAEGYLAITVEEAEQILEKEDNG